MYDTGTSMATPSGSRLRARPPPIPGARSSDREPERGPGEGDADQRRRFPRRPVRALARRARSPTRTRASAGRFRNGRRRAFNFMFRKASRSAPCSSQEFQTRHRRPAGNALKVTLVWTDTDPARRLQNDLDLIVRVGAQDARNDARAPAFDRINNVEQMLLFELPPTRPQTSCAAFRIALEPNSPKKKTRAPLELRYRYPWQIPPVPG